MKNRIPKSAITEKQLRKMLKQAARDGDGTISSWANDNKITPQAASAFMRGVQTAGLQIPEALGYYPQTIYLPLGAEPIATKPPSRTPPPKPVKKAKKTRR